MQIDGFTVAAQIVNFLILVGLLKHFLYGPITQAIAARQQKITAALEEAQRQIQQAVAEQQTYQALQAELDAQRETALAQVGQEVATQRQAWLAEARREVDALRADEWAAWQREQADMQRTLQREAACRLTAAVRHALRALADADLEQRMLEPLLARLRRLEARERAALIETARNGCTVRTAFPLDAVQQAQWQTALGIELDNPILLTFRHDADAVCGVILETPGYRLTWTLDSYLDGFNQQLDAALKRSAPITAHDHAPS